MMQSKIIQRLAIIITYRARRYYKFNRRLNGFNLEVTSALFQDQYIQGSYCPRGYQKGSQNLAGSSKDIILYS